MMNLREERDQREAKMAARIEEKITTVRMMHRLEEWLEELQRRDARRRPTRTNMILKMISSITTMLKLRHKQKHKISMKMVQQNLTRTKKTVHQQREKLVLNLKKIN